MAPFANSAASTTDVLLAIAGGSRGEGKALAVAVRIRTVILVLSDTHGSDGHRLSGRTLEAVHESELVCHCGDFVTDSVLDAFESEVADASAEFATVYGNNDPPDVRDRTAETRVVDHDGVRLALAHGHEHSDTSLALFGRQANADLVCVGHSHDPGFGRLGSVPVLNPGSHAEPRFHRPAHAELQPGAKVLDGKLVEPDGTVFERFELEL